MPNRGPVVDEKRILAKLAKGKTDDEIARIRRAVRTLISACASVGGSKGGEIDRAAAEAILAGAARGRRWAKSWILDFAKELKSDALTESVRPDFLDEIPDQRQDMEGFADDGDEHDYIRVRGILTGNPLIAWTSQPRGSACPVCGSTADRNALEQAGLWGWHCGYCDRATTYSALSQWAGRRRKENAPAERAKREQLDFWRFVARSAIAAERFEVANVAVSNIERLLSESRNSN